MNWAQYKFNLRQYRLSLWRGWLWKREAWSDERRDVPVMRWKRDTDQWDAGDQIPPYESVPYIEYKVSKIGKWRFQWGPWSFLPVYLTTYLLSTLLGHPIRPFSGVLYARVRVLGGGLKHPWSLRLLLLINRIMRDETHCELAARAPVLWRSASARQ